MVAHLITEGNFSHNILLSIINFCALSTFTWCFLFLSGLGMYSSYSKCNNIKVFYSKRIKRVWIPFLFISLPYFIYTDLLCDFNISSFLLHLSTLSFWIDGNYSGMWYISAILALYLLYPFIPKFLLRLYRKIKYGRNIN